MNILLLMLLAVTASAKSRMELQWALCGQEPRVILDLLAAEDVDYAQREITYFESEPAHYFSEGVSFRRKTEGRKSKLVVKARFASAEDAPDEEECEWDRHGETETYTCELETKGASWTREQMRFVGRVTKVDWAALAAYGPYPEEKWEWVSEITDEEFSLERLDAGHGRYLTELSLKVPSKSGDRWYRRVTEWLKENGVKLCRSQEGKSSRLFRGLKASRL